MGEFPTPLKSKIRPRMPFLQDHLLARRRILSESPQDSRQGLGVGAGAQSLVGAAFYPLPLPTSTIPCSSALPLALLAPDLDLVSRYPGKPKAPTLGRTGRWRGPRLQLGLPVGLIGERTRLR